MDFTLCFFFLWSADWRVEGGVNRCFLRLCISDLMYSGILECIFFKFQSVPLQSLLSVYVLELFNLLVSVSFFF